MQLVLSERRAPGEKGEGGFFFHQEVFNLEEMEKEKKRGGDRETEREGQESSRQVREENISKYEIVIV